MDKFTAVQVAKTENDALNKKIRRKRYEITYNVIPIVFCSQKQKRIRREEQEAMPSVLLVIPAEWGQMAVVSPCHSLPQAPPLGHAHSEGKAFQKEGRANVQLGVSRAGVWPREGASQPW